MSNPRYGNGNFRRKMRKRMAYENAPCHICHGKRGPIDYAAPSDAAHPLSFVIDEIIPISRYKEFGYESRKACAMDPENLAPAHWICNQEKSNKINFSLEGSKNYFFRDGEW